MDATATNVNSTGDARLESTVRALYLFICISGTITNTTTIGVILSFRSFRQRAFNVLILYLTIVDFVACLLTSSVTYSWLYLLKFSPSTSLTNDICQIMVFLVNFSKISSLTGMTEIAILRLICVSSKMNINGTVFKRGIIGIVLTNFVTLVPFSAYRTSNNKVNICTHSPVSSLWINISIILLFAVAIITTYAWIAWKTRQHFRRVRPAGRLERFTIERYDIATIITCISVVVVFVLCHLPVIIYGIVISKTSLPVSVSEYTFYSAFCWGSNIANPIVMFCTCKDFRQHVLMKFDRLRAWFE